MDSQSAFLIFASIIGFIILIVVIIAILYKPAKKLMIQCQYIDSAQDDNVRQFKIYLKNTGKKSLKIVSPYISFSSLRTSQNFQLKPEKIKVMFPRIINVNEDLTFEAEIGHFDEYLAKSSISPSQVRIIIKDTEGLEFNSNSIDYRSEI